MVRAEPRRKLDEELEAQRIACDFLVRGCQSALSDLQASSRAPRAGEIMEEILASWRETLALLESAAASGDPARKSPAFTTA